MTSESAKGSFFLLVEETGIHSVWKLQKKSHSTLRAKRATFLSGQKFIKDWPKMPKLKNSNETFLMYINPFLPQCEGFLLSARQQNCAHFFFFTTSFNHPVDTKLRPIFLLSMLLSGISKSLIKGTQFCFPLRPEPPNECDKSRDFQSLFSDD